MTGKAPSEPRNHPSSAVVEELLLGHVVHRPPAAEADDERVDERSGGWRRRSPDRSAGRARVRSAQAPVQVRERLQPGAHQPVDDRVHARSCGRARDGCGMIHGVGDSSSPIAYTERAPGRYSRLMALDRTRTLRGALAGAAAAAVWAAQQPLDQRVFGVQLRRRRAARALRHRRSGPPTRRARDAHRQRRAVRRASTPTRAARSRSRRSLRGPLAGLVEHLATWPGTAALSRVHPAAGELPELWGSGTRLRAGHLAPPAVRRGARRARAPPEPARLRTAPDRSRGRRVQRTRVGRVRRLAELTLPVCLVPTSGALRA